MIEWIAERDDDLLLETPLPKQLTSIDRDALRDQSIHSFRDIDSTTAAAVDFDALLKSTTHFVDSELLTRKLVEQIKNSTHNK